MPILPMKKQVLLVVLPLVLASHTLLAANVNWNVATGEWKDAVNWNPQVVPSASTPDTVFINNGGVVTVSENASATAANVGSGGTFTTNGLTINSGITLTTTGSNSVLGSQAGQFGTADVSGIWTLTGRTLTVGAGGTGTLNLYAGGSIASNSLILGSGASGLGTATISGNVTTTAATTVGNSGTGNLIIASTGTVQSGGGTIGSTGSGTASVSGLWNYTGGNFTVGQNNGSTGRITIENGGEVRGTAINNINLGNSAGAYGEMTVKNGGIFSSTGGGTFTIGSAGEGKLTIESGGEVRTFGANLGNSPGGQGTVNVSGTWTNSSILNIGASNGGTNGTGILTIESGGVLNSGVAYLGGSSAGMGNGSVTVKTGGSWESTNHILVGQSGTGSLTVENGATVKSIKGRIAVYAGGSGTAHVSGIWEISGPSLVNDNTLSVGDVGTGGLTVGDGGEISSYSAQIGVSAGSSGSVTVENGGSLVQLVSTFLVGNSGTGSLLIENGGSVETAGTASIGYSTGGVGAATVRGNWTIGGADLEVGRSGTGALSIGAGGLVNVNAGAGTVYLARSSNAAVGVLNIGGSVVGGVPEAAEGAGVLNAGVVTGRTTATVTPELNFNHTGTNYVFQNSSAQGIVIQDKVKVNVYAGTTSLTAASTYTAGTEVHAGTLLVNNTSGSGTGTGAVQVHEGATLGGSGILSGATTVDGILSPGNSIGTLTVNNTVTWNFNDAWVWELGTAGVDMGNYGTSDLLSIGGNFVQGTGTNFVFDFADTGETGWYRLITWSGSSGFDGSEFLATNLGSGLAGDFVVDSGALYLNVGVIPEPSALALFAVSGVALMAVRRRRRA